MVYYAVIMILAGLLFLALGLNFLRARILFIKHGIEAEATVIRIELSEKESHTNDEMVTVYRPHFKVITHNNQEIKFIHGISTQWGKWSIGDKIKVVYGNTVPGKIIVRTFWGTYGRSVILFSIAFALVSAGVYVYFV